MWWMEDVNNVLLMCGLCAVILLSYDMDDGKLV